MTDKPRILLGKVQKKIIDHLMDNGGSAYLGIGRVIAPLSDHSIELVEKSIGRLIRRGFVSKGKPGFYELTERGKQI